MNYIKLVITITDEYQEPFIAELSEMGLDGFEQFEDQLITYIEQGSIGIGDRERIEQLLAGFPGHCFIESEQIVREENWNEQWGQTIGAREIEIGRASGRKRAGRKGTQRPRKRADISEDRQLE